MPNPLLKGNVGMGPSAQGSWPWQRSKASGELFAQRIGAGQLQIGKELAEGNALPPPPELGTVLRRGEGPRPSSKLWSVFRQTMKRDFGYNDKWLDARAGALKTVFADLHHLRKYLQGLHEDEDKLGSYVRDIRESTVRALNDISKFNDLNINDGVFRKFLSTHVPEIDGKIARDRPVAVEGPTEQDPEQEDLTRKLTAWFE